MTQIFEPLEIIDPLTGQKRVLSPEEQEELLEAGIIIGPVSLPPKPKEEEKS